jgi:capsular polysaccharide biosynthesis protein
MAIVRIVLKSTRIPTKDRLMNEEMEFESIHFMEHFAVAWKRRWHIVIPTVVLALLAAAVSMLLPKVWEVETIIIPSKFLSQSQTGEFRTVLVVEPKQIAGQIVEGSYDALIAAELAIPLRHFPKLKAENLRDTNLVRVSVREKDPQRGRQILASLFNHIKSEFDKKINVEISNLNTEIEKNKNGILSDQNKLQIAEQRIAALQAEMKSTKTRIEELGKQQQRILSEKKEGAESLALLLYSNEVQTNLRYFNSLEEMVSGERVRIENLRPSIANAQKGILFLEDKKARIDYTQLIKEPTASLNPVSPKKVQNALIAGFLGFCLALGAVFFRENFEKQKRALKK